MAVRIEVISQVSDTRAGVLYKRLRAQKIPVVSIELTNVYTLDKTLTRKQLSLIKQTLINPVTQTEIEFAKLKADYVIEIGFLPGVTDNVAATTKEMIEDLLRVKFGIEEGIYTSQVYYITGEITKTQASEIADSFYNPIIQRAQIKSYRRFKADQGMDKLVPRVKLTSSGKVDLVNLEVADEELKTIGKQGIQNRDGTRRGPLALGLDYMKSIQAHFKKLDRSPTDVELESLAQTWSEHCKHTIFADPIDNLKDGLYDTYIKAATNQIRKKLGKRDFCVSVFTDNSGAIEFDDKYLVTHKVETHNSPSALDPFGGAITGIVGVNRDAIGFGLGAKPIANTYGFCFADPKDETPLYKGANFTQKMLSPGRIMEGVIAGVNSGGNCSGIPTPQGFLFFDRRYKGKPLVFVGTVGLIPKKVNGKKAYVKKARPGDYIVMVGGRVGLDGIHGATFSSEAMDSGSPATAVQIGDPITQKKLSDAVVKEARDLGLFNSITDNGAGGLSCSVAEMAKECGGCKVALDKVPLKYPGLSPWQIWISESQERMTLSVPKNKWKKFADLMKYRGVEATVIGTFTDSGKCIVQYKGKVIMDVAMHFLHDGLPKRQLTTTFKPIKHAEPRLSAKPDLAKTLLTLLARPNITSFEFVSLQYDHEVQSTSVLKPLQGKGRVNGEATVVKPVLSSSKGFILSQGLYPAYSDIDTYHMAASCIDTAIRNVVATGGDPEKIALLDNFCWCSSNEAERLGQLKRAAKACYDYSTAFGAPFISGKDSMFNDFKGFDAKGKPIKISVPPTLLVSAIAVVDDVKNVISIDVKFPGDVIYVLGETFDELGGSEYFSSLGFVGNRVPEVNAKKNLKLYKTFYAAVQKGLIASAISVTRGGLAVALSKMSLAGRWGIDVSLKKLPGKVTRNDFALFSESQGRIIATVAPQNKGAFEKHMKGISFAQVGMVTKEQHIKIRGLKEKEIINCTLDSALKNYKSTFHGF